MTRSTQRTLCAAMLSLQAVVLFLTGVVAIGVTDLGAGTSLGVGLGLAARCVLAAGMLRSRAGYLLGWGVQVLSVGLGFVVPTMFFLGVVFGGLWATAYFMGARIDVEKAERAVAQAEWSARNDAEGAG